MKLDAFFKQPFSRLTCRKWWVFASCA